tara:strand:- start:38674 stop:38973 length:300 start_codon:yes stop_codon:yes gene_type:complete
MSKLTFKTLQEAAEYAEVQDKRIASLEVALEALVDNVEASAPKTQAEKVQFKVGKDTYEVKSTATFTIDRQKHTGADLVKNTELAKRLVDAKVPSIKKV